MSILVVSVMSARESATVSSERCVSASQGSEHRAFRRALPFQMLTKLSSMAEKRWARFTKPLRRRGSSDSKARGSSMVGCNRQFLRRCMEYALRMDVSGRKGE
jgi:hypothetical protein